MVYPQKNPKKALELRQKVQNIALIPNLELSASFFSTKKLSKLLFSCFSKDPIKHVQCHTWAITRPTSGGGGGVKIAGFEAGGLKWKEDEEKNGRRRGERIGKERERRGSAKEDTQKSKKPEFFGQFKGKE